MKMACPLLPSSIFGAVIVVCHTRRDADLQCRNTQRSFYAIYADALGAAFSGLMVLVGLQLSSMRSALDDCKLNVTLRFWQL